MSLRALAPVAAAAGLGAALLGAQPAVAGPSQISIVQDDNKFIYDSGRVREDALDRAQQLGADAVRITVLWHAVAPGNRRPRGPLNRPGTYPQHQWDRYDDLVKSATRRGLFVYFNVTGPGPRWAHATAPDRENQNTWMPDPREFGRFVAAVGRRFSGGYRDENGDRARLPRVNFWSVYNEPNQGGWLMPQAQRLGRSRSFTPTSPHLYRELLVAGLDGLVRTGHRNDRILFGETAPLGEPPRSERRPLRPALFLRELFCLDARYRPFRGAARRQRGCANIRRLSILNDLPNLGFGHHPYSRTRPPTSGARHRDEIPIGVIGRLPAVLDRIAARTGLLPAGIEIFSTEFGYETEPPDVLFGVSLDRQAAYINEGDYLAFLQPRLAGVTQFQLLDVLPLRQHPRDSRRYWSTYQSGLFFANGNPKPSAYAYAMPIVIRDTGTLARQIWGQARFLPNNTEQTVFLQYRVGDGGFQPLGDPVRVTDPLGFYQVTRDVPGGAVVRAVWTNLDFTQVVPSRQVRVP